MKMLKIVATACVLMAGLTGMANAALTTYDFNGITGYSTNDAYSNKNFEAIITINTENSAQNLVSWCYKIDGNTIETFDSNILASYNSIVTANQNYFSFASIISLPNNYKSYLLTYNLLNSYNGFQEFSIINGSTTFLTASISAPTITTSSQSATPTPIPAAGWLLGSGLVGMIMLKRRKPDPV